MDEKEKTDLKCALVVLDLIQNEKIPFDKKKGKMKHFINMINDKSIMVYGMSLAVWAKEFGDENLVNFMKEKEVEEKEISKEKRDELGKQFWDENGKIKSIDKIKELVMQGADLGVKSYNRKKVWMYFNLDVINSLLKDLPKGYVIKGDVNLNSLNLTELPDFSKIKVRGRFDCSDNKLTTLQGAPEKVEGDFWCAWNQLRTLEGATIHVGGNFDCDFNQLTTLEGAPLKVGGSFYCRKNKLTSLKGKPEEIGGEFRIDDDVLEKIEEKDRQVKSESVVKGFVKDLFRL